MLASKADEKEIKSKGGEMPSENRVTEEEEGDGGRSSSYSTRQSDSFPPQSACLLSEIERGIIQTPGASVSKGKAYPVRGGFFCAKKANFGTPGKVLFDVGEPWEKNRRQRR